MLLDPRERLVFMQWCRQQAESCKGVAAQMEKLPGAIDEMVKRERAKAVAFHIVALELASVREEFSVRSEDIGDVEPT